MNRKLETLWAETFDPKQPIVTQIHRCIRSAILSLDLKPNEALSEKELSLKFAVSRTPVREALIKLSEDGLVDILPQRGSFVAPIRIAEVVEAQFIREALEIAVIRRVAADPSERLLNTLEEMLRQQRSAISQRDFNAFLVLDESFHRTFCEFCELPRGWKMIQNVKGQLDRVRFLSLPEPGHLETLFKQHQAVVEAVRLRQPDLAAAQLKRHLQEVFGSVELLMRSSPSLFGDRGRLQTGT